MTAIKNLIKESIAAGFYNIDIDASTMVDLDKTDLLDQQEANGRLTAELTKFIRSVEPKGITISVGGEIGEIGHSNSTVEDLRAYMQTYRKDLPAGMKGISKISVQTGTTHGGVVLPDGSIAKVQLDFDTLEKLSKLAGRNSAWAARSSTALPPCPMICSTCSLRKAPWKSISHRFPEHVL